MKDALLAYQLDGANHLAARHYAGLVDEMRVGKTPAAIRAADYIGAKTVNWITKGRARWGHAADWRRFQIPDRPINIIETSRDYPRHGHVNLVSYDLTLNPEIREGLVLAGPDVTILDEFHRLGDRESKRTKAAYGPGCSGLGGETYVSTSPYVWVLSGTPIPRDVAQLWPTLHALFPDTIPRSTTDKRPRTYWQFVDRYCTTRVDRWGHFHITGAKNLDELRLALRPYFLRRRFDEVNRHIPPIRYLDMPIDTEAYLAALDKKALAALGSDAELETLISAIDAANDPARERVAQICGLAKVGPVSALIREELEEGLPKVVIFAWHRGVIEAYAQALKDFNPVVIYGGSRARLDEDFNNNPACRVCLAQIDAAGEAISLASADEIVFAEGYWTPGPIAQAARRCSSPTKHKPVRVRFALADTGIDARIMRTMRKRAAQTKEIFDEEPLRHAA